MVCPLLPAGPGVTGPLTVSWEIESALRSGLSAAGYPVPQAAGYGPELAQAIYAWQRDHPLDAGADWVVSTWLRGPNGAPMTVVGCPTYRALGVACERVECLPSLLASMTGMDGAMAALICSRANEMLDLQCTPGAPPAPGQPPSAPPTPAPSPWPWLAGIGALWWFGQQRRRGGR